MKNFSRLVVSVSVSITITACVAGNSSAADRDPANYVGVKTCGICHKKEESGNQLAAWQASPHAKAFELLGTPEAKAAGAKLGVDNPQTSGKCLKCHSTAYNFTETVATEKIKPEDGVTCESCHGPGKTYMAKSVMEDQQKAIAAGLIHPASQSCTLCHNDQNPMWKPDRYTTKDGKKVGFDFDQAFEKIKHPDPKLKK
jgi:hypothetical protein